MLAHFARSGSQSHPDPSKNPRSANDVTTNRFHALIVPFRCIFDAAHRNESLSASAAMTVSSIQLQDNRTALGLFPLPTSALLEFYYCVIY